MLREYKRKLFFTLVLTCLLLFLSGGAVLASDDSVVSVSDAVYETVEYYQKQTIDHWEQLVALDTAGEDLSRWDNIGLWDNDVLDEDSSAVQYAGRILGLQALGRDPENYNGVDLIAVLKDKHKSDGSFGGGVNDTIWAIIALDQAGADYNVTAAVNHLLSQKLADGGYAYSGTAGEADLTGDALIALSQHRDIAGVNSAIKDAIDFLKEIQLDNASFASWGSENSQSVAKVISGLLAVGEDILEDQWQKDGKTLIDALFSFRLADGTFKYGADDKDGNAMATRQVLKTMADLVASGYGDYRVDAGSSPGTGGGDGEDTVKVTVRVESVADAGTILEETEVEVSEGSKLFTALASALDDAGISNSVSSIPEDGFLSLNDIEVNTQYNIDHMFWLYTVDDDLNTGTNPVLADGQRIVVYLSEYPTTAYAKISVEQEEVQEGDQVTVLVEKSDGGWPASYIQAAGVTVKFGNMQGITDAEGKAVFSTNDAGTYLVYAEKYNEMGIPEIVKTASITVEVREKTIPIPDKDEIEVYVEVIGKKKNYFADYVILPVNRATVLDALDATGLSYKTRENGGYVYEIAGEREELSSTAGWKYKVGSRIPNIAANEYELDDGDELLWFWAEDYTSTEPSSEWLELQKEFPITEELQEAIEKAMDKIEEMLEEGHEPGLPLEIAEGDSIVIGTEKPMTKKEKEKLAKLLQDNVVSIAEKVKNGEDTIVTDPENEISFTIGKKALKKSIKITVKELSDVDDLKLPVTHGKISPVYEWGPAGTVFEKPVYMSIRIAVPEEADPKTIVLAWYDQERERWMPLPTVVDLSTGTVTGMVEHFSRFAVLVRERQPNQFEDVTAEKYPWAVKEIGYLATKEIISGVGGNRFEPDRPLTRAEFTTLLVKALGLDMAAEYQGVFADVDEKAWYAPYVQTVVDHGIVRGLTEDTFGPDEKLTREQLAVLLFRALDLDEKTKATWEFKDQHRISSWAAKGVSRTVAAGLIKGFPDGTFAPQKEVNRAQSAVIIYRMIVEH